MKVKNKVLVTAHLVVATGYVALMTLLPFIYLHRVEGVFMTLIFLHFLSACCAAVGRSWGRRISQMLGILLLIGIPVGTILGCLILSRSGTKWADDDVTNSESVQT